MDGPLLFQTRQQVSPIDKSSRCFKLPPRLCDGVPEKRDRDQKHTTPGIRWSSPTQLLIRPLPAYLGESGRDPEFSGRYGRM
ncbi:hypothetical protein N658DRAFT_448029, partial [Parathielavia hyrcaniae]